MVPARWWLKCCSIQAEKRAMYPYTYDKYTNGHIYYESCCPEIMHSHMGTKFPLIRKRLCILNMVVQSTSCKRYFWVKIKSKDHRRNLGHVIYIYINKLFYDVCSGGYFHAGILTPWKIFVLMLELVAFYL